MAQLWPAMKSLPNLFVDMSKKGFDWGLGERERGSLWAPHPISSLLSYTEKYNGEKSAMCSKVIKLPITIHWG